MDIKKQALQDFANDLSKAAKAAKNLVDSLPWKKDVIDSADSSWVAAKVDLQGQIEAAWRDNLGGVPVPLGSSAPPAGGPPPSPPSTAGAVAPPSPSGDKADAAMKFDDFLTQIGKAMATTQRQLDAESLTYLKEISRNRHALPTIFRIPKLSADMKFMLETEGGKTTNLLFFKTQNLAKDLHQQSIHFELVSAPPPPEVMAAIQSAAPRMELVLDPAERRTVLAAAAAAAAKDQLPANANSDRVVILGVRAGQTPAGQTPAEQGYVVLYAAEKPTTAVGMWLFSDDTFRVIYSFETANSKTEKFLRAFVSDLAAQQVDFLGGA